MPTYLPSPKEVRELLADLLGREVTLSPATPFAPGPRMPATFGVYVDDRLQVAALIAFDVPLSAYVGAAIGLVPQAGAFDAIAAGTLGETLRDNLSEVLNIAASLFNVGNADHVRLYAALHAGDFTPQDITARALTLGLREDWSLDVAGYGAGRLSIILT